MIRKACASVEPYLGKGVLINSLNEDGLIAFEKSIGVLSHPNEHKMAESILLLPYSYQKERYLLPSGEECYLCNRLDKDTSGIVLAAMHEPISKKIKDAFENRKVNKVYYALVHGKGKSISWKNKVVVTKPKGKSYVRMISGSERHDSSLALTHAKVLSMIPVVARDKQNGSPISTTFSLMELHPVTGFTHQLRYQAAAHHLPILGDPVYGNFELNKRLSNATCACVHCLGSESTAKAPCCDWILKQLPRLFLHCHRMSLTYETSFPPKKQKYEVTSHRTREIFPLMGTYITHET